MPIAPRLATNPVAKLSDYSSSFVVHSVAIKAKNKHLTLPCFFPSKIGGKPAFLTCSSLPSLTCNQCASLCSFLLQLYVPIETTDGFHRSLFVFVCHSCGDEFKLFRQQLPRINSLYPPDAIPTNHSHVSLAPENSTLCTRCGLPHSPADCRVHVYPEWLVESEEASEAVGWEAAEEEELSEEALAGELAAMEKIKAAMAGDEEDDMPLVPSESEEEIFWNFVEKFPGAVALYNRETRLPLWLWSEAQRGGKCGNCGNFRLFEFQLLPGLIDKVRALSNLDFAVVAAFTCECDLSGVTAVEQMTVQKEPESWWKVGSK
jgi:hypothetical protein